MSVSTFSPEEIAELREAFDIFDKDGGGTIDVAELRAILDNRGKRMSDKDLVRLMDLVDEDRSGEIDFDEFVKMMTIFNVKMSPEEEIEAAYAHFDVDGDGKVGAPEIKQVFEEMGHPLDENELKDIMVTIDGDGDGYVSLSDFKNLMLSAA